MLLSELNLIKATIKEYIENFWRILKAQIFIIFLLSFVLPISFVYTLIPLSLENSLLISLSYSVITIGNILLFSYIITFTLLFYRNPSKDIKKTLKEVDVHYMKILLFLFLLTTILFFPTVCYYQKSLDTVKSIEELNIKNINFLTGYFLIALLIFILLSYVPAELIENRKLSIKSLMRGAFEFAPYILIFYCFAIYILIKNHLVSFFVFSFFVSPFLNILYWKIYRERVQNI